MYKIHTTQFSGPLDLLLRLIEQEELKITEISLAQVTDQYLKHLEKMENKDPEDLADFLVIAARLLLLKSRALLPNLEPEEEADDLEKQLKLYKEFLEASKKIEKMIAQKRFTFSRERLPIKTEVEFSPPQKLKVADLKQSFLVVLKRLDLLLKLPRQAIEKTISLQQKILEINNFIKKHKKLGFKSLMEKAKSRAEIIVNFLAVLELLKQEKLRIRQKKIFDDIIIEKI